MENEGLNISLSELTEIESLSKRTQNICEYCNLKDIHSILDYYWENFDFLKLRNCGAKSNLELIDICHKYEKIISQQKEEIIQDSHINSIAESIHSLIKQKSLVINIIEASINELSLGSSNVLKNYLSSNTDIIELQLISSISKSDLRDLRSIGEKSIKEISTFLKSIKEYIQMLSNIESQIIDNKFENQSNPILNKINSLNEKKVKVIDNIIEEKINYISNSSRISLMLFLNNDLTLKSLKTLIFSNPEFKIEIIQDLGDISKYEIKSFLSTIKEQVEFISELSDPVIEFELFKIFIKQHFSLEYNVITDFFIDYNIANGLPIFKVINILIDNGKIFEERGKVIFYNEYSIAHSEVEIVAINSTTIIGVTQERIRQIKMKFLQEFNYSFNFITEPEIKSLVNYGFDLTGNYLEITNDLITYINKFEKTNFNRLFITKIIALLYANKYDLIGKVDHINATRNSNSDNWRGCYIVDKQLTSILDFDRLIDDVKNIVTNKIEEDCTLHFRSYLLKFRKTSDFEVSEMIVETAKYILFCEFDLNIDANEGSNFIRNTAKRVYKYSYEALEKLGKPSKVCDIHLKVKELYPDFNGDQNCIGASMKRKYGFVPIGRSSVFGLKNWESTIDNFKGGTIKDIVEEYLQIHAEPKHINEISEYVCKYRNTSTKSIYTNLHSDQSKKFVFFRGAFIGICNKEYSAEKFVQTKELQKKENLERKVQNSFKHNTNL